MTKANLLTAEPKQLGGELREHGGHLGRPHLRHKKDRSNVDDLPVLADQPPQTDVPLPGGKHLLIIVTHRRVHRDCLF